MSHENEQQAPQSNTSEGIDGKRRSLLATIGAGVAGATFFGPWKANHVWAQAAQKKPRR